MVKMKVYASMEEWWPWFELAAEPGLYDEREVDIPQEEYAQYCHALKIVIAVQNRISKELYDDGWK
jgi:hypothetical protein